MPCGGWLTRLCQTAIDYRTYYSSLLQRRMVSPVVCINSVAWGIGPGVTATKVISRSYYTATVSSCHCHSAILVNTKYYSSSITSSISHAISGKYDCIKLWVLSLAFIASSQMVIRYLTMLLCNWLEYTWMVLCLACWYVALPTVDALWDSNWIHICVFLHIHMIH